MQTVTGERVVHIRRLIHKHEEICPDCGGFAFVPTTTPHESGKEDYSLIPCVSPYCLNGIRRVCKHCREGISKPFARCHCPGAIAESEGKAPTPHVALEWSLAKRSFTHFYLHSQERVLTVDEVERMRDTECGGEFPHGLYLAIEHALHLSAAAVVRQAAPSWLLKTETLPKIEPKKMEQLQFFLDQWCADVRPTTVSYSPDYDVMIVADKEAAE